MQDSVMNGTEGDSLLLGSSVIDVSGHGVWWQATVTYYLLLDAQHSENQNDYLESKCEELVSSRFM
jgi:hypothetical protein